MQGLAGGSLNSAAESFSFTIILDSPVPRRKILRTPWRDFYSVGDRKEVGRGGGLSGEAWTKLQVLHGDVPLFV